MTMENQLEVEKAKMMMLVALTNPEIGDAGKYREWSSSVNKIWSSYLALQFGIEVSPETEKEIAMREFYETRVKNLKPKIEKAKKGFKVTGLEGLL